MINQTSKCAKEEKQVKMKIVEMKLKARDVAHKMLFQKRKGIDGILVTVGLCIIALLLCVVMKDSLATFIQTIVTALTQKATGILG